ncbi:AAA family ATPase [Paenibacillus lautus]|uniref:AAA family ATPase n=1 Tax=Paenibacillus lautus TaxID=1401 RepID=UPI003D9A25EA
MRIKELRVSNFRNFDEEVLIVPKVVNGMDMVVLVGENNAGKTSILTILHYLFNPERSIRTLEFQETDFYDLDKPIRVEVTFSDLSDELRAHFIGIVDSEEMDGKEQWFLPLVFTCVFDKQTKESEPSLVYGRQPERSVNFSEKRLISFYYQDALRDYRAIKSNKGSMFGRILKQIDISAEEQVILDKLDEAGDSLKDNIDIGEFIGGVTKVTRKIIDLPDVSDLLRLTVAASSTVDIKKNIQLQLKHVAMIDYDSKDSKHDKELDQIKEITDNIFELPRHVDMGDIEGYVCLHAPIAELISFLEESLPP